MKGSPARVSSGHGAEWARGAAAVCGTRWCCGVRHAVLLRCAARGAVCGVRHAVLLQCCVVCGTRCCGMRRAVLREAHQRCRRFRRTAPGAAAVAAGTAARVILAARAVAAAGRAVGAAGVVARAEAWVAPGARAAWAARRIR